MRVALTGAAGLIGEAIRSSAPAEMTLLCHTGPDLPHADMLVAKVSERDAMADFLASAEVVVHLAGPPSVAGSFKDPLSFVEAHVMGAAAVIEAAKSACVRRVVLVSSAEIYGRARSPVAESAPVAPRSPYGAAKAGAEALFAAAHRVGALEAVILRPFSVIGAGARRNSLLGDIFGQLGAGETELNLRDLRPVRDYVFVQDVAAAAWKAVLMQKPDEEPAIFNIASGQGTSVEHLAKMAGHAAGREVRLRSMASPDRPAQADILDLVADISRAKDGLGWSPKISLQDGLAQAYDHFCRAEGVRS